MTEVKKITCCFTGHRPEKLADLTCRIQEELEKQIHRAFADGFRVFITGMARGVDIWAAEIVLKLRDAGLPVKLLCACPYKGFEQNWSQTWQKQYHNILAAADDIKYISPNYSRACFQLRNRWMVDHASKVIAVFNGENGGTKNTIAYAEKNAVPVVYIKG